MVGNEKSMLHLIVRESSGSYNISNNSGNYTDNIISLPGFLMSDFITFTIKKQKMQTSINILH